MTGRPTRKKKPRNIWLIAAVGLLYLTTLEYALPFEPITGVPSIVDGDSIEIHGHRLRLFGIDAVESDQLCRRVNIAWRCGKDAAFALANKINNSPITCIGTKKDQYDRFLVTCYKNQENLNYWMVSEGWALAYKKYSKKYSDAENEARKNHRGLWSGQFEAPWDWRRNKRTYDKKSIFR